MEFDTIGYVFSNGTLILTVNEEVFNVHESDPHYHLVWVTLDNTELSPAEKVEEIKDILKPTPQEVPGLTDYTTEDIAIDRFGTVFVAGQRVDDPVTRKIAELSKAGGGFAPLVQFMNKVSRNPDAGVREQLFRFLDVSGFPLSEDGDFLGYKGVRSDLWDAYTAMTFQYNPGVVVSMPRDEVCDDPHQGCAPGIHVGSFEYAKSFSQVVVLLKVDPANVVSVPTDYSNQKLRACEITVARVVPQEKRLQRAVYEDSDFDEDLDEEEWEREEELAVQVPMVAVKTPLDRMSRDALCTHAGTTEFFESAAEARFMGKSFTRKVLMHEGFDYPKVTKQDLRKLLARRNVKHRSKATKADLAGLCAAES